MSPCRRRINISKGIPQLSFRFHFRFAKKQYKSNQMVAAGRPVYRDSPHPRRLWRVTALRSGSDLQVVLNRGLVEMQKSKRVLKPVLLHAGFFILSINLFNKDSLIVSPFPLLCIFFFFFYLFYPARPICPLEQSSVYTSILSSSHPRCASPSYFLWSACFRVQLVPFLAHHVSVWRVTLHSTYPCCLVINISALSSHIKLNPHSVIMTAL